LEEIFEKKLEEENDLIKFLYNPNKFYLDKIKDKYNSIMDELISNKVYIDLIKFYKLDYEQDNEQVDHFKNFCDSLKTKYNDTLIQIEEDYQKEIEEQNKKAIEEKIEQLNIIITDVNKYATDIKNYVPDEDDSDSYNDLINKFNKYNSSCNELQRNKDYLTYDEELLCKYYCVDIEFGKCKKEISVGRKTIVYQNNLNLDLDSKKILI
jgi:hypothetical protein